MEIEQEKETSLQEQKQGETQVVKEDNSLLDKLIIPENVQSIEDKPIEYSGYLKEVADDIIKGDKKSAVEKLKTWESKVELHNDGMIIRNFLQQHNLTEAFGKLPPEKIAEGIKYIYALNKKKEELSNEEKELINKNLSNHSISSSLDEALKEYEKDYDYDKLKEKLKKLKAETVVNVSSSSDNEKQLSKPPLPVENNNITEDDKVYSSKLLDDMVNNGVEINKTAEIFSNELFPRISRFIKENIPGQDVNVVWKKLQPKTRYDLAIGALKEYSSKATKTNDEVLSGKKSFKNEIGKKQNSPIEEMINRLVKK